MLNWFKAIRKLQERVTKTEKSIERLEKDIKNRAPYPYEEAVKSKTYDTTINPLSPSNIEIIAYKDGHLRIRNSLVTWSAIVDYDCHEIEIYTQEVDALRDYFAKEEKERRNNACNNCRYRG